MNVVESEWCHLVSVILLCLTVVMDGRNLVWVKLEDHGQYHEVAAPVCQHTGSVCKQTRSADALQSYDRNYLLSLRQKVHHSKELNCLPNNILKTLQDFGIKKKRKRGHRKSKSEKKS